MTRVTAYGGAPTTAGYGYGGAGTIYMGADYTSGTCVVDNHGLTTPTTAVTDINATVATATGSAGSLTVQNSGQVTVEPGTALTLNGSLLLSSGSTLTNNGTLNVAGNWTNSSNRAGAGYSTAGTGTVVLNGLGQSIYGNTTFCNFTKSLTEASHGDLLLFASGSTTTVTGLLTLQGLARDPTKLLELNSSGSGAWTIVPPGALTLEYLMVYNSIASTYQITADSSVDGGGNNNVTSSNPTSPGWIFTNAAPVAYGQVLTVVAGSQTVITLTGSDDGTRSLTFPSADVAQQMYGGKIAILGNNQIQYTAPATPCTDSFTFMAFDGLLSAPATVTIFVQLNMAYIGITWADGITAPQPWAIGPVTRGADVWAKVGHGPQFSVQNISTGPEQFTVSCAPVSQPGPWQLYSSVGADQFEMHASADNFGSAQNLYDGPLVIGSVASNSPQTIGLHFKAPTSTAAPAVQQTITITITAQAQQ